MTVMKKLINLWPAIKHKNKIDIKIILHCHYKKIKVNIMVDCSVTSVVCLPGQSIRIVTGFIQVMENLESYEI